MRAEKHRRATDAAREGVLSGLMEGGESLITGLASGVTGLFSKPIEGALQNGPSGFVRGIGIGVVGVAVGPVLGVADGLNSVAQTLFIQSSEGSLKAQIRSARTFNCTIEELCPSEAYPLTGGHLVLTPIDLYAVRAQAAVQRRAKKKGDIDSFVGCCCLEWTLKENSRNDNHANVGPSNSSSRSSSDVLRLSKSKTPAVILSIRYVFLIALKEVVPQGPSPLPSEKKKSDESALGFFSWNKTAERDGYEIIPWNTISHFYQFHSYRAYTPSKTTLKNNPIIENNVKNKKQNENDNQNREDEDTEEYLVSTKNKNNNAARTKKDLTGSLDSFSKTGNVETGKNVEVEVEVEVDRDTGSRKQREMDNQIVEKAESESIVKLSKSKFKSEKRDVIKEVNLTEAETPGLWGLIIVRTNKSEITIHCPTHEIALKLSILLEKNNKRVRRPQLSYFMPLL